MPELKDDLFDDGDDEGEQSTGDSGTAESEGDKSPKSSNKRISDLQSKADKETARANKAEARLKLLQAALDEESGTESGKPPVSGGGPVDSAILDMARMFAFQQHPKLAEYGLSEVDLNGGSPSDIARAATDLVAHYEKIETRVRNKVLASQGLAPELDSGSPPAASRDFTNMSSEDFKKVYDAAMNKR